MIPRNNKKCYLFNVFLLCDSEKSSFCCAFIYVLLMLSVLFILHQSNKHNIVPNSILAIIAMMNINNVPIENYGKMWCIIGMSAQSSSMVNNLDLAIEFVVMQIY